MSSNKAYLALRLKGPFQSWGFDSQFNRRATGLMPTKSGMAGMCCAALGFSRGSEEERRFLLLFGDFRMTTISIPVVVQPERNDSEKILSVQRLQDYQTVQNTRRASGTMNDDCVLTYRQYLTDASFGVVLSGSKDVLEKTSQALANPQWGLWLGRKCCIPSAPVLAGLENSEEAAFKLLIGDASIESFTRQIEVENFADGLDSLPDQPLSFKSDARKFSPRRVKTEQAKISR